MTVVDKEQQVVQVMIPLDRIVSSLPIRKLSVSGIARLQESMRWAGFLDNFPLMVAPLEDGMYDLIDGNHRYEAAKGLGIVYAPCVIKSGLSEAERYQIAMQSNSAAETVVRSTLVTYAEFIWARLEEVDEQEKKKYTQSDVGRMLGWDRASVRDYAALRKICLEAWQIIGATFEKAAPNPGEASATPDGALAPFSENLLRPILDLTSKQQIELVTEIVANKDFSKGKFKTLAKNYQIRNEMYALALKKLKVIDENAKDLQIRTILEDCEDTLAKKFLGEKIADQLKKAVYSGAYDTDWEDVAHPRLHRLIQAIRDEWEQKNNIFLIHGDFYKEVHDIGEAFVDLILTDPPYNIASKREFIYEGRSNVSQDFGEWDKHEHHLFINTFSVWACEWARILRPQGSGYVFTSDRYLTHLREALEHVGLHVKATIVWHKTNPGTQAVKTSFKSSVEYILFFTKGEGGHTFHWQGENEMHNFIESPICGGKERLKDAKGDTLHPTQKPESIIKHLMEISSNRGDMVFDGFAGVGTSGAAAKQLGRKFIGIEQDDRFFEAMQRRLAE